MSGSGNDFIIIDNRKQVMNAHDLSRFIVKVCRRKMSAGADGLILIEDSDAADFKWHFYNADGTRAEMCGNGARCAARFAYLHKIAKETMSFETDAGIVSAQVENQQVKVNMPEPADLRLDYEITLNQGTVMISSINTGVPHVIMEAPDIESVAVVEMGREIRLHDVFSPSGTNVNFVARGADAVLWVRTYERGVEDETLACGTGCIAAALIAAAKGHVKSPVMVKTSGGSMLKINFKEDAGRFHDVFLEGDARIIYKGVLCEDAWADV